MELIDSIIIFVLYGWEVILLIGIGVGTVVYRLKKGKWSWWK